jgi:hypothetical protein
LQSAQRWTTSADCREKRVTGVFGKPRQEFFCLLGGRALNKPCSFVLTDETHKVNLNFVFLDGILFLSLTELFRSSPSMMIHECLSTLFSFSFA